MGTSELGGEPRVLEGGVGLAERNLGAVGGNSSRLKVRHRLHPSAARACGVHLGTMIPLSGSVYSNTIRSLD